eukprot:s862_g3.t1
MQPNGKASRRGGRRVGETLVVGVKPRMCQLARFREQSFADFTELSTVPYCHLKTHSLRSDGSLPFALPLWMAASQMLRLPGVARHPQLWKQPELRWQLSERSMRGGRLGLEVEVIPLLRYALRAWLEARSEALQASAVAPSAAPARVAAWVMSSPGSRRARKWCSEL